MLLVWKDAYSVGVDLFDSQHKKLFEICNELNDAHQKGIAGGVVEEKLKELYQYSYYHFDSEEKDLEENGYEELENQKKEHNFFKKRLSSVRLLIPIASATSAT